MKPFTLKEIEKITGGEIIQGDPGVTLNSVSIDTRKLNHGELFFALVGERYDAHSFLADAVAAGAGALVVNRGSTVPVGTPVLAVNNTLDALQMLAAANRERCVVPLIGITGSTGKTTTKDMVAGVLSTRLHTLKTAGNYNNEIGLPLTLLEMDHSYEAAVIEMAMRGPGEIDALCRIASPRGAVITNIGETHLERLGTVSNIAAAKGELLEHIPTGGFALLNAESPYIRREAARCRGKVIFFSIEEAAAEIKAEKIVPENGGSRFHVKQNGDSAEFFIPVPGRHNVLNALAAIGVGRELGLTEKEIARGLAALSLTGMRLQITEAGGRTIIDDTYNASPASTIAALQVLEETAQGRRTVAVLGNMLELGAWAAEAHREVGKQAAGRGIDYLVTVGDLAAAIAEGAIAAGLGVERVYCCKENLQVVKALDSILLDGDVVLVKGSRGMKMEQIVQKLLEVHSAAGR